MTPQRALALMTLTLLAACASTSSRNAATAALDAAIAGSHRPAEEVARDRYRHPRETLLFFGLRADQTVVEIMPAPGGWYTKILAPVLRERGKYVAALPPVEAGSTNAANTERMRGTFLDMLQARPELYDRVQVTDFLPGRTVMVPDGSADMVLTFRNMHNWMARREVEDAFRDMYRALRRGGTLGITEHRGNEAVAQDPRARLGYVNQSYAIELIESVGFRLVATSEINANPLDTKDHPNGVWSLPPQLAGGDTDRAKYLAIGESDRFTLKFVKP